MNADQSHAVLVDLLLDYEFENVDYGVLAAAPYVEYDREFGMDADRTRCKRCKRAVKAGYTCGSCADETGMAWGTEYFSPSSMIEVKIYKEYVVIEWINVTYPQENLARFRFPFPEAWPDVVSRLKQFVEAAKHKERTGEVWFIGDPREEVRRVVRRD